MIYVTIPIILFNVIILNIFLLNNVIRTSFGLKHPELSQK
jgi:hypothetical protein